MVIVLARSHDRYYKGVLRASAWTFDFHLFKVGEEEPLATSASSYGRSCSIRWNLDAGDYVVHVSHIIIFPTIIS